MGGAEDQIVESLRFDFMNLVSRKRIGDKQVVQIRIDCTEHSDKNDRHKDPLKNSHR